MICAKCGGELNTSWTHCPKCGLRIFSAQREKTPAESPKTSSNISGKEVRISRIAETILGVLGGVFGLGGALFALTVGGLGGAFGMEEASEVTSLGFLAIFFSILGIVGGATASRNSKVAGILMLVAGIGGLVAISLGYIVAAPLLIVGGILSLVRKGSEERVSK